MNEILKLLANKTAFLEAGAKLETAFEQLSCLNRNQLEFAEQLAELRLEIAARLDRLERKLNGTEKG